MTAEFLPPPSNTQNVLALHDLLEEFKEFVPWHIRKAKIVLVTREFMEKAEATLAANGIPTGPKMILNGYRLMAVERMS